MNITYIQVDETHRIEVMPGGNHYPQYLSGEDAAHYESWNYYLNTTRTKQKNFKTEAGCRKFLATAGK